MSFTAPGYGDVATAFHRNFTAHGEVGAAFAAYRDGQLVVDLWDGTADPATGRPWTADTLALIFSGTKGLAAACVLLLAERGRLDLDAPVARYWPAFAAAGKASVTVADVLSHQARLPHVRTGVTIDDLLDQATMAGLLAAQPPEPDPRAGFMYHALTFGWLVAEVVQRVDGRRIGDLFADEFARPLGLDAWIGLPDALHHRTATMLATDDFLNPAAQTDPLWAPNPIVNPDGPAIWNSAAFRRGGLAAVGGHATARAMARFYACLAAGGELDGVRVLAPSTVARGHRELRRGVAPLWGSPMAYGAGFELHTDLAMLGPVPDAYGHCGAGGSRHGTWPKYGVAFSYTMNEARAGFPDPRPHALLTALAAAVGAWPDGQKVVEGAVE